MSKFYNISFVCMTFINFLSLIALYVLLVHNKRNLDSTPATTNAQHVPIDKILVQTKSGMQIYGQRVKVPGSDHVKVDQFLGIPYAQPPINQRRFKPPEPFVLRSQNQSYLEALKWPNPCMQPSQSLQLHNTNFSEDCLYLNIWSPGDQRKKTLLPVIVVIHTGAFIFGSASETKYNGLFLAKEANVVVAVFNYRLNFYGFFYQPSLITANVGLLDQLAALQWIHENIESFHGDPNRITLVGQSSGALSVGMHMLSEPGQKLFHQAILMSGSPFQIIHSMKSKQVATFWNNYIRHLECHHHSQLSLIIDCVNQKINQDQNNLVTMKLVKQLMPNDKLFVNIPIVFENVHITRPNISLLFGYTNDEGSWISMLDNAVLFGPHIQTYISSQQEAIKQAELFLDRMSLSPTNQSVNRTKMISHYLDDLLQIQRETLGFRNDSDSKEMETILHRLVSNMLGDRYIVCPMEMFADWLAATGQNGSSPPIYQYYWQYKGNHRSSAFWSTFSRVWCGHWMGSCHSFEMYALFGIPFLQPDLFNHQDRIVSIKTILMVKYFAYNGKLFWPPYEPGSSKWYYNIDQNDEQFLFGQDNFKHLECKQIWSQFSIESN